MVSMSKVPASCLGQFRRGGTRERTMRQLLGRAQPYQESIARRSAPHHQGGWHRSPDHEALTFFHGLIPTLPLSLLLWWLLLGA